MGTAVLSLALVVMLVGCTNSSDPPVPVSPQAPTGTQPSGSGPGGSPGAGAASPGPDGRSPATRTAVAATMGTPAAGSTRPAGALAPADLQGAWSAKGLAVATGTPRPTTGFSVAPSAVRLTRGSETSELLVFTYPSQAALEQDWTAGTETLAPREGRTPGSYGGGWWNHNTVILVLTRSGVTDDAREAFLGLGAGPPPAGTSTPGAGTGTATARPGVTATGTPANRTPGPSATPVPR